MGEPGRIQVWWGELPKPWRVNVTLYVLATLSLFALIVQVLAGDETPRRVEVASEAPRPTTPRVTSPTTVAASSTTAPTTPAPPTTGVGAPPTANRGQGDPGSAGDRLSPTPQPSIVCRNSSDSRCGPLSWDPPAGDNAPLSVEIGVPSSEPSADGQRIAVTFMVTVRDPDHVVTGNCTSVDYGDGRSESSPCEPPPCPAAHGPWDPPPREAGSREFSFSHEYAPGRYAATFTFHTDKDRCPDPYGSVNTGSIEFILNPPASGT